MKVSLGMNLQTGPWGGGNQFGLALANYLRERGVELCFDLAPPDLDVILLAEPRAKLRISAYTDREILQYLRHVNPKAIVVHRVNECDERKGTKEVNRRLRLANLCADHTVFVSNWLRNLHLQQGMRCKSNSVIRNGSDRAIFHPEGYRPWHGPEPLKLVTHHWGAGQMKGFDIYERLDRLLATRQYVGRVQFTYIGNLPAGFQFRNTLYLEPMHGDALADGLRRNHVYLTASQNEPGGHHQNEGANCGLPLLYRESGSMPEYCQDFGVSFTEHNFEEKLQEMMNTYPNWVSRMKEYPNTAERMCDQYYRLFLRLLSERAKVIRQRRWWRWPLWYLLSLRTAERAA